MNNIELKNLIDELVRLAEQGKNPIPFELLDKQIELLTELKQHCNHINYVTSEYFKHGQIENEISAPVMNLNTDLITVLKMRIECYERMRDTFVV